MSDEMFVRCCAPTLAGIKTGSMTRDQAQRWLEKHATA